jgi:hypothetical protein
MVCLGTAGALATTPAGALAAPHRHLAAAPKAVAHPRGFFVSGSSGRATSSTAQSALVRDSRGGQHVITSTPSSTPNQGHLVYLTRQAGAKHWTSHPIPGLRPTNGGIGVEEHVSVDGKRIEVVIYECDGVFAADTNLTASRMPEPTQIIAENNCATATAGSDDPPRADAIAIYARDIGVLLPDPKQDNRPALFVGTPGQDNFLPGDAIPTTDGITIDQITRDPYTGKIIAVGQGSDATTEGIYVTEQGEFRGTWSAPVRIASLNSATTDFTVESVTSFKNSIWVGLERPTVDGVHPTHTLYLVHGTSANEWDGAIPLPHATSHDTSLRLLTNPATGHLHAAFTRVVLSSKANKSGILQEARTGNKWSQPRYITHWYLDTADQITINAAGRAVIGYEQG